MRQLIFDVLYTSSYFLVKFYLRKGGIRMYAPSSKELRITRANLIQQLTLASYAEKAEILAQIIDLDENFEDEAKENIA